MNMFLNIGLAKVSTFLAIILSLIYILRVANKKFFNNDKNFLYKLNKALRKHHKTLGIILVTTGLIHGIYSSDNVLSLNWGTVSWIFSLLLGINWMIRKKLKTNKSWVYYHRILTVLFLLTMVIHIVEIKNRSLAVGRESENLNSLVQMEDESILLKDGTYYGEADAYKPNLNVEVVIENGLIESVTVTDNNETPSFLNRVIPKLTDEIVETQSTDVDIVSGATYSSIGIINATNEALDQAQ